MVDFEKLIKNKKQKALSKSIYCYHGRHSECEGYLCNCKCHKCVKS